jgi:hypothetical protein
VNKRLGILMLAAGAMLLTACGEPGSTTDAKGSSADVKNVTDSDDSVDCGVADLEDLGDHNIWAGKGAAGIVDCAEAYDVAGEYLRVPFDDRTPTPREAIRLAGGWACDIEETEIASLYCYKGDAENAELTFHTVPAREDNSPTEDKSTECGEFDVDDTVPHMVVADGIGNTVVSCDEAFDVLAEYLRLPAEERDAATVSIPLASGWACLTDDGGSIGCSSGETAKFTGMFHTVPVGVDAPVDCGQVKITDDIAHNLIAKAGSVDIVDCADAINVLDEYLAIPVEKRNTGVGFDNIQVSDGWACGTYDGVSISMSITCGKGKVHGKFDHYFQTEPV